MFENFILSPLSQYQYVSLFSFVSFVIIDYLIKNNYLPCGAYGRQSIKKIYFKFIGLSYFSIVLILFTITFLLLMLFYYFDISLISIDYSLFDSELFNAMTAKEKGNINVNADPTINLNHPNINLSLPTSSLNNLAAAASVAGGGGLAFKVMQVVAEGPGAKTIVGAGTMLVSQAATLTMSKILNSNNSSNNKTNNLIDLVSNLNNSTSLNNFNSFTDFNEYEFPLNLLPELDKLVTAELLFLTIILNIFIVKYITTLDYNKYLPNNKLGRILNIFINRYITI